MSELRELRQLHEENEAPEAAGGGSECGPAAPAGDCLKKAVRPRLRRRLAQWAQDAYRISERHAARLVGLAIGTLRYRSRKAFDEVLRHRLRELAGTHVRYGYRRLTELLRRDGWHVNAKRIYWLYQEEPVNGSVGWLRGKLPTSFEGSHHCGPVCARTEAERACILPTYRHDLPLGCGS